MVSPSYMTERRAPPGAAQLFLNQRLVPAAIDGLAGLEVVAERLAQRVRGSPAAAVVAAIGLGFLLALPRRRRR